MTADKHWTNLPVTDLFVPAVMELHRFAARRRDASGHNLGPDSTYRSEIDPGVYRPDITVRALGGDDDERTFTAVEPKRDPAAPAAEQPPWQLTVPMRELRELGAYAIDYSRHDGVLEQRILARNPAPGESRLQGFTDRSFARLFPPDLHDRVTFVAAEGGIGTGAGEGEIWKLLAVALLLGLLAESFLAMRFGRR